MRDFLADCKEDFRLKAKMDANISEGDFKETFCAWCRNADCPHSHKEDLFTQRVSVQAERLLRALQTNPELPRYASIVRAHWEDMKQRATALEISSRRGDWSVPTPEEVERAAAAVQITPLTPPPQEEGDPVNEPEDSLEEAPLPKEPPKPLPRPPKREPTFRPAKGNTNMPIGGIMLGGDPAPTLHRLPADPWAPPPKPKGKVVKPGATIRFGAGGSVRND